MQWCNWSDPQNDNPKVVQAMKTLQALYNNDANKIVKKAAKEKGNIFFIDLLNIVMVTKDTKLIKDEP